MNIEEKEEVKKVLDALPIPYFWVFSHTQYYPNGGLGDLKKRCFTKQEAEDYIESQESYFHEELYIVDMRGELLK